MDLEKALRLVKTGDLDGLDRLAASCAQEGVSAEKKRALTRAAARAGQARMLRHLFERNHLYEAASDGDGRTVLHDAALSGDADTAAFAVDVLGFDPLTGDKRGRTALEEAAAAPRQDAYRFLTGRLGFDLTACYRNPVLRGFHPDPSVVRRGEDYYLVNSSFVFFPGLPIFHSRDLTHWTLIGHAAENLLESGLEGLPGGYGYWAPDISYFGGRFWIAVTLRRDTPPYRLQMITSASSPEGPWDPPRFLPLDGIDPSLFTDGDGRRYILLNPGAMIAEIDVEGKLISDAEMIYFGAAKIKPEGPHLLKKDGWYYLFLAEGGTGEGHMETVMRSRQLKGPYEACPYNPILGRRQTDAAIRRSGHGKPVMTPDGRWYMVYLCGRSVEGKTVMGRETALDPITWTRDGWPVVNDLKGPSCLQAQPYPGGGADGVRNEEWIAPRTDPRSFAQIDGDTIRLRCGADPASTAPCSVLLRRQTEACFSQSVRVEAAEIADGGLAGLTGYYDERSFFLFGLRRAGDRCALECAEQIGDRRQSFLLAELPEGVAAAVLAVEGEGLDRRLLWSVGGEWRRARSFRAEYLSDEGVPGGKRFTGALIGLAAVGGGSAQFSDYRDEMREPGSSH